VKSYPILQNFVPNELKNQGHVIYIEQGGNTEILLTAPSYEIAGLLARE
jgi:hypothetical protein